jgi:hypothetical protein
MADIVTVTDKGATTHPVQFFFDRMRQRRFARTRKPGKPEYDTPVPVLLLASLARHRGMMPDYVIFV